MNDEQDGPPPGEDLTDANAPFDASQWAMHGLLSVFFHRQASADPDAGARRILERIHAESAAELPARVVSPAEVPARAVIAGDRPLAAPASSRWKSARRWIIGASSLAAAAAIVIAVALFDGPGTIAKADIYTDAANAGSAWFLLAGSTEFVVDPDSPEGREQQRVLADLEKKVRENLPLAQTAPPDSANVILFCQDWQKYYCLLRDVGRRDDAIREAQAALAFARGRPVPSYICIYLDGLANIHSAFGEYAEARESYEESLQVRLADTSKDALAGHLAIDIGPIHLRLTALSLAEGNTAQARVHFTEMDRTMCGYLRTLRAALAMPALPPNAALWDLWQSLPDEYRRPKPEYTAAELRAWPQSFGPNTTNVMWVRSTLFHEAVLLRAEGKDAQAQAVLDRAAGMADYPDADEHRLPFNESLEAARLAIARKDYPAALSKVKSARTYILNLPSRMTTNSPAVNRLPVNPTVAAQLDALEGVARLAMDKKSLQGRQLIEKAQLVIDKLAAGISQERREAFVASFVSWHQLVSTSSRARP